MKVNLSEVNEFCRMYIQIHMENELKLRGAVDETALIKSALEFAEEYLRERNNKFHE